MIVQRQRGGYLAGLAALVCTAACVFLCLERPAQARHLQFNERSTVRVETHLDRTGGAVDTRHARAVKSGGTVVKAAAAKQTRSGKAAAGRPVVGKEAVHGQSWGFDTGRSAEYWSSSGVDGNELLRKAVRGQSDRQARKPVETKSAPRSRADAFSFSVDRETADIRGRGRTDGPDEDIKLESSHRVRAFATMQDKDVTLGVGPEVIVRDQQQVNKSLNPSNQPDVDAGVGMRLMIDF